jgi:hypothetical protein
MIEVRFKDERELMLELFKLCYAMSAKLSALDEALREERNERARVSLARKIEKIEDWLTNSGMLPE